MPNYPSYCALEDAFPIPEWIDMSSFSYSGAPTPYSESEREEVSVPSVQPQCCSAARAPAAAATATAQRDTAEPFFTQYDMSALSAVSFNDLDRLIVILLAGFLLLKIIDFGLGKK